MSDAAEYESVRVSTDGVRVEKRFAADEFPVPAIAFDFTSGRDEEVTVRLADTVPGSIDVEDLGFHPDYGSEFWTIEEGSITFERELDAQSSYTTVYGIRAAGDDIEPFLTEPTIEKVDPPLPEDADDSADSDGDNIVLESDDAIVEDAIASGLEQASDDGSPDSEGAEMPTLDLSESDDTIPDEQSVDGRAFAESESLVSVLADELRADNATEEDIELVREALSPEGGSTTARLDQIQRDITNLRAYANAFEEFLDEQGTGQDLIEEFSERIETFETQIEQLETDVVVGLRRSFDTLEEEFESLETRVSDDLGRVDELADTTDEFDDELDNLAERIDSAAGRTAELTRRFDEFDDRTDDLSAQFETVEKQATDAIERAAEMETTAEEIQTRVETVETQSNDVAEQVDTIQEQTDSFEERFDAIESRTETVATRSEDVAAQTDEIVDRLDDIATRTEEIATQLEETESDIQDLQEWKEQITQTFGG